LALSFKSEDYKNPRLFPIILNKNAFIQRPHPVLVPNTSAYRQYWLEQSKRCVEGFWGEEVKDTFRYMSGPLYWHINMWTIKIQNKKTKSESYTFPDLRDVEWIIFNAFLCCQGFSGFADDETTTCNRLVKKYYDEKEGKKDENGDLIKLTFKEKQDLENSPNVKTPKGKYKEYVEAYEYLKRTFPKPLGLPLYENEAMDLLLLSSRYTGKSYSMSSLIGHEYTWQGKRYFDAKDKSIASIYVGAATEKYSIELLEKVKDGLEGLPGAYGKGDTYVPSPMYRNSRGTFKPRGSYVHEYKVIENGVERTKGSGSTVYHGNLGENPGDALGKRLTKIIVDEIGELDKADLVHANNERAMKTAFKFGWNAYSGTGGNISRVTALKDFFYNPARNSFYPFPDMWEGTGSIGLFIPATYADSSFKDENGNTNLELSLEQTLQDRKQKASGGNAVALDQEVMFMPLKPSEIFTIPNSNIFPISLARERLIALEQGLWKKKAQVGWLEFADKTRSTAKWCAKSLYPAYAQIQPINYYALDSRQDLQGAVVIYEHPIPTGKIKMSGNPYRIVYDPVAKDDGGTSLSSILVYKSIVDFEDDVFNLTDTIVAEYIGRTAKLEDTHDLAIKLAMYYNAKVYPETNLTYFVPYAQRQNWGQYLQLDMGSNNQNVYLKTGRKVFGKRINSNEKVALDQLVNTWLRDKVGEDEDGNDIYVVDNIWSMRLLDEIIQYGEGNFDHISSLRLLAFWNSREAKQEITVLDEQDMYKEQLFEIAAEMRQERRLKCLDY